MKILDYDDVDNSGVVERPDESCIKLSESHLSALNAWLSQRVMNMLRPAALRKKLVKDEPSMAKKRKTAASLPPLDIGSAVDEAIKAVTGSNDQNADTEPEGDSDSESEVPESQPTQL